MYSVQSPSIAHYQSDTTWHSRASGLVNVLSIYSRAKIAVRDGSSRCANDDNTTAPIVGRSCLLLLATSLYYDMGRLSAAMNILCLRDVYGDCLDRVPACIRLFLSKQIHSTHWFMLPFWHVPPGGQQPTYVCAQSAHSQV